MIFRGRWLLTHILLCLVFIYNHKLNAAIYIDLEGIRKIWTLKKCNESSKMIGNVSRRDEGHSPELLKNGLLIETHMSEELEMPMVSNGDLVDALAVSGPKVLHDNAPAQVHSPKDPGIPSNHIGVAV